MAANVVQYAASPRPPTPTKEGRDKNLKYLHDMWKVGLFTKAEVRQMVFKSMKFAQQSKIKQKLQVESPQVESPQVESPHLPKHRPPPPPQQVKKKKSYLQRQSQRFAHNGEKHSP